LFRLELKVQMGEDARTLLEVCDGSYFWRCEWYKGKCIAEKTDLARAVRAWEGRRDLGALGDMGSWPRLGGLSRLLRELRNWFQFVAADETKLADQTPVIRLHGVWRPERLATLAPGPPGRVTSGTIGLKDLPEHLPDSVMLFLDRDDLFPFRIEYRRQKLPSLPVHAAGEEFAIVTMDFYLVNLNQPIDADRFAFSPRNLNYSDQTDRFLERLGLKRE
jgi:hypothetical protein